MRIATWNLNHRVHPRVVPPWVTSAMRDAMADIFVLTEYVPGKDVPRVAEYLSDHGAASVSVSGDQGSGDNRILIASKERHVAGPIPQPDIGLESAYANFLCVTLASGVIVVGFRMPEYSKTPASFAVLWDWLFAALAPLRGRDLVLLGDLNTDFERARDRQYRLLERFTEVGLTLVPVAEGVSYQGKNSAGSRLDHAFVGGNLQGVSATYEWGAINAAHPECRGCNHGVPDHAMLIAEVSIGKPGAWVYREDAPLGVWIGGSMDFISSIKRNCTTAAYAQFSGRASRSEYWWFYLFTVLAGLAADMVGSTVGNLATLFFFLPGLALMVRRLHDVGRSGWWFLIVFTIIGIPVFFYWLIKESDAGANRFGEGPARA